MCSSTDDEGPLAYALPIDRSDLLPHEVPAGEGKADGREGEGAGLPPAGLPGREERPERSLLKIQEWAG